MKYALINGEKTEAANGSRGFCPSCGSELIAKCGEVKINHWAHKGKRNCDPWWENETEWHRNWKNKFPEEWQEEIHTDPKSGEKHIADVRAKDGLVLEFQHSYIKPEEQRSREAFYKRMVWIVDGTRLKRDFPRFLKGMKDAMTVKERIYSTDFPEEVFPKAWVESEVPVILDFGRGTLADDPHLKIKQNLYCLLPIRSNFGFEMYIAEFSRKPFIENVINCEFFKRSYIFWKQVVVEEQGRLKRMEIERKQAANRAFAALTNRKISRRRRIF
ncbi:competence protein CoiA family protein [Cryomorphaceae bacterium 1068]|nr:competence protein CoiA family protein [Cryomorphaceae bacterium 1068]